MLACALGDGPEAPCLALGYGILALCIQRSWLRMILALVFGLMGVGWNRRHGLLIAVILGIALVGDEEVHAESILQGSGHGLVNGLLSGILPASIALYRSALTALGVCEGYVYFYIGIVHRANHYAFLDAIPTAVGDIRS